jgi:hypothetical protein
MKDSKVIQRIRQMNPWAALEGARTVALPMGIGRHHRVAGAGRKPLIQTDPGLQKALEALVHPTIAENAAWPLRWTCLSTAALAEELQRQHHPVCDRTVACLLQEAGYSLQDKRRCNEGSSRSERDAQFARINEQTAAFHALGQPVVWVDARKMALANEEGWVSAAADGDTARFSAESLGHWWREMGRCSFPGAIGLLITADVGASNASRSQAWKAAFQDLANATGLLLEICHFPPGTTKWRKIEYRHRDSMAKDWRVIVHLIASSIGNGGPHVPNARSNGIAAWNYAISPV